MSNNFKVKRGLIINNTQIITGITDNSGLTNESYSLPTMNAIKGYIDSKITSTNTQIIVASGYTNSGTSSLTYNNHIFVSGDTKTSYGVYTKDGGMCIQMVNKTGSPLVKGKLVTYSELGSTFTSNGFDNGFVYRTNTLADDKILVIGTFTSYSGTSANRIIKLNSGGTIDTSFSYGTGFNSFTYALDVQSDGKILVGGGFTTYSGITSQNYIIRLLSNGTKDTGFTIGTGFNSTVNVIKIQSDGNILVGGGFTTYSGITSQNRLIRLLSNGTKDTGFTIGTGFNGSVNCISIQPSDGRILVGGGFTTYKGSSQNQLIRLNSDGSKDTGFTIGDGFYTDVFSVVTTIDIQTDGKILVGGHFITYSGTTQNYIVRLLSNGTKDTGFTIGVGFSGGTTSTTVNNIKVLPDGKILVGGIFNSYSGITRNNIIKLDIDGSIDTGFTIGTGFNSGVYWLSTQTDGKILVGGQFTLFNNIPQKRLMRLNSNGTDNSVYYSTGGFKYFPSGTSESYTPYIGITTEDGVADGNLTPIVVYGVCYIDILDGVYLSDKLSTYYSTSDGDVLNTLDNPGWVNGWYMACALEDGGFGLTKCFLFNKDTQY